MIPHPHRQKGGGPQLGARGPHQRGPFGTWPDPDEPDLDDGLDDGQDDELDDQDHDDHKLNGVDGVQYMLEAVRPFGVNVDGCSRLRVAKDRPAQVRRHALPGGKNPMHWFADLVIVWKSDDFSEAHLYPPIQHDDDPAEMTAKEEREAQEEAEVKERAEAVIKALSKAAEPLSKTSVEELVPGRASITRRALTRLVHEGRVETTTGPRNAVLHSVPKGDAE